MKRCLLAVVAGCAVLAAVTFSRIHSTQTTTTKPSAEFQVRVADKNPWNHLKLNNDSSTFRFAIVTDRTGGARAGVFERAVEQLNWLQPEFVVSVGDLIQGSEDLAKINQEWKQFNCFIEKLEMPFFYLAGNHDISNALTNKRWNEQFGRSYYHFIYKDVLFLLLNSEDPPKIAAGKFSKEQIDYVKKVLADNKAVRWTLVFVHKPVWTYATVDKTGWLDIEKALAGRRYTVFSGHKHKYERFIRQGQRYYMFATTGGVSKLRGTALGEFDHLIWVTMKNEGPVLANLMMEGIFSEDLKIGLK